MTGRGSLQESALRLHRGSATSQGSEFAEQAWREYHRFIVTARDRIAEDHGRGFHVDVHGHSHPTPQVELRYLLTGSDLGRSGTQLNAPRFPEKSSIRSLARVFVCVEGRRDHLKLGLQGAQRVCRWRGSYNGGPAASR